MSLYMLTIEFVPTGDHDFVHAFVEASDPQSALNILIDNQMDVYPDDSESFAGLAEDIDDWDQINNTWTYSYYTENEYEFVLTRINTIYTYQE